jgi:hypothetical protein
MEGISAADGVAWWVGTTAGFLEGGSCGDRGSQGGCSVGLSLFDAAGSTLIIRLAIHPARWKAMT